MAASFFEFFFFKHGLTRSIFLEHSMLVKHTHTQHELIKSGRLVLSDPCHYFVFEGLKVLVGHEIVYGQGQQAAG